MVGNAFGPRTYRKDTRKSLPVIRTLPIADAAGGKNPRPLERTTQLTCEATQRFLETLIVQASFIDRIEEEPSLRPISAIIQRAPSLESPCNLRTFQRLLKAVIG
ncbi:hypothetical protein ASF26_14210 [Methylobacterium sp. Leaf93]|nr:hypothetical protein ASF26_14210 [Methylobacterium sp. Leaf93]